MSLAGINIVCDRGSNCVCAFKDFKPIFCFSHRLNNVLKVSFFQETKTKKKPNCTNVFTDLVVADDINVNHGSPTDESESSSDDDCNTKIALPVVQWKTNKKLKKPIPPKNELEVSNKKIPVEQIPAAAKRVLECLNQCKKVVKYMKKVRTKLNIFFEEVVLFRCFRSLFNCIFCFRPALITK